MSDEFLVIWQNKQNDDNFGQEGPMSKDVADAIVSRIKKEKPHCDIWIYLHVSDQAKIADEKINHEIEARIIGFGLWFLIIIAISFVFS